MIFNWSGDYATATARAEEAGVDINLEYHIPEAGDGAWFDVWIVPKDAKNIDNAYLFLDYMSRPMLLPIAPITPITVMPTKPAITPERRG